MNRRGRYGAWLLLGVIWWLGLMGAARALPPLESWRAPNGVLVLLAPSRAVPMVEARLLLPAGSVRVPPGQEGLAALTADLLDEGAGGLDRQAFHERLEFHGIQMGAQATRDYLQISLTTLSEHLEEACSRLGDLVLRPRFDPADFQRVREVHLASLEKRQENPDVLAILALFRHLYGSHPYGASVSGVAESVGRITLEQVREFHRQWFHGPGTVLAVAGDVTMARVQELFREHLAALPDQAAAPEEPLSPVPTAPRGEREFIHRDLPQVTLRLGVVGIRYDDPDFFPALVMNHILGGGGFTSRLMEEIREKRGLTYGVFSYLSPMGAGGPLVIGLDTKTASAREALRLVRRELRRLAREGVGAEELADAQRNLTGSFPLKLDGLDDLAGNLATIGFYGLGLDYLERYRERVAAVTPARIQRVAERLLELERFHLVAVGKRRPW